MHGTDWKAGMNVCGVYKTKGVGDETWRPSAVFCPLALDLICVKGRGGFSAEMDDNCVREAGTDDNIGVKIVSI